MTLSILKLQQDSGSRPYDDEAWHLVVETHLPILRAKADTVPLSITPHDAYKYEGDLFGLLREYHQPPDYFFIVMRVNGMYAPTDYTSDMLTLLIPSQQTIEAYRQVYQTISAKMN